MLTGSFCGKIRQGAIAQSILRHLVVHRMTSKSRIYILFFKLDCIEFDWFAFIGGHGPKCIGGF